MDGQKEFGTARGVINPPDPPLEKGGNSVGRGVPLEKGRSEGSITGLFNGKSFRVPPHRRIIVDLMHLQKELPMVAHDRVIDLTPLVEARRTASVRISWTLLYIKAFALVAREFPQLRQTYIRGMIPKIYQHETSTASVAVSRQMDGYEQLFFARFESPDQQPLHAMKDRLEHFQNDPVEDTFGDHLRFQKYPWMIRRFVWWTRLAWSGRYRVQKLGTFGLTTLAGQGTSIQQPICPMPYLLTYGPMLEGNRTCLTISYDHRLLDGVQVAKVLSRMAEVLNSDLRNEIMTIPRKDEAIVPVGRIA